MTDRDSDYYGTVVGWTSQDFGRRLVLRMQSVTKPTPHTADDVDSFFFMIDKNDAVLLANYLYDLADQTAPRRKKRWLDRLVG